MLPRILVLSLALAAFISTACGPSNAPAAVNIGAAATPSGQAPAAPSPMPAKLDKEPAGAVDIVAARKMKSGAEVAVKGHVKDIVAGMHALVLLDCSMELCEDGCECCEDPEKMAPMSLPVRFVDAQGQVLRNTGAAAFKRCDEITVKGILKIDDKGNPRLEATGYFSAAKTPAGANAQ